MSEKYAILAMPRSGSSWFLNCILKTNSLKCDGEFFNSLTNPSAEHKQKIATGFGVGLELFSPRTDHIVIDVSNIAVPSVLQETLLNEIFQETWKTTDLQITKEVYAFHKVEFFEKKFTCFGFVKPLSETFPGSSKMTVLIFARIYGALLMQFSIQSKSIKLLLRSGLESATSPMEKAIVGWIGAAHLLISGLRSKSLPIIDSSIICNESAENSIRYLHELLPASLYSLKFAEQIIETRKSTNKTIAPPMAEFAKKMLEGNSEVESSLTGLL
mgnify:CR=1 FL=1